MLSQTPLLGGFEKHNKNSVRHPAGGKHAGSCSAAPNLPTILMNNLSVGHKDSIKTDVSL